MSGVWSEPKELIWLQKKGPSRAEERVNDACVHLAQGILERGRFMDRAKFTGE